MININIVTLIIILFVSCIISAILGFMTGLDYFSKYYIGDDDDL